MIEKFRRSTGLILVAVAAAALLILSENRTFSANIGTDTENRLRSVLSSVAGAGDVELMVNEAEDGSIIGVCVLSTHADDVATVFRIRRAVQTALGVENGRIEVIMMEANDG